MFRSFIALSFGSCLVAQSTANAQDIAYRQINGPAGDATTSLVLGEAAVEAAGGLISGQRTALPNGSEFFLFSQSPLPGNVLAEDANSPSRYTFSGLQLLDGDAQPVPSLPGEVWHGYFTIDGVPQPMSDPFGRGFVFVPLPSDPSILTTTVPYHGSAEPSGWNFTAATDVGTSGMGWTGSAPGSQAAMAFGSTEVGLLDVFGLSAVKHDINGLHAGIVLRPTHDCNSDGMLNVQDLNCSTIDRLAEALSAASLVQGDANGDGAVGFDDFLILSDNFGGNGTYTDGDFDLDGTVAFADFLLLSDNFGKSAAAVGSVPEPTTAMLLLVALITAVRRQPFRPVRRKASQS